MQHVVEEVTLKSGSKGLIINIPSATVVAMEFAFRAGDVFTDKGKIETAHLMEHLLLGANKGFSTSKLFQAEIEKNGAYNNASTDPYFITYEAECADFEWDRIVGLLIEAICSPLFKANEFEAEYGSVVEELTARSNNHFRELNLKMRTSFGLAGHSDQERLDLMSNVTLLDVKNFYQKTHFAKNMSFVIAGNFDDVKKKQLIDLINEKLTLPIGDNILEIPAEQPKLITQPVVIHNDTVKNLYFTLEMMYPQRINDQQMDSLVILTNILTDTMSSRIMGVAREKGLVYMLWSGLVELYGGAGWWIGGQVSTKKHQQLMDLINDECYRIREGKIDQKDLEAAKLYSLGKFQRSAQTAGGVLNYYSRRYFMEGTIEDVAHTKERINAINQEVICHTYNLFCSSGVHGIGMLGAEAKTYATKTSELITNIWV